MKITGKRVGIALGLHFSIIFFVAILLCVSPRLSFAQDKAPVHRNLLLFIHGLNGDGEGTWKNATSGAYWPTLISTDRQFSPSFDVSTYTYPASLSGAGLTTNEYSTQFAEHLSHEAQMYDKIFIIAHSYGGVITMDAAIKLADLDSSAFDKVQAVFLMGVPARGTHNVTKILRYLVPSLIVDELRPFGINSYLQGLEQRWHKLVDEKKESHFPLIFVAYETKPTHLAWFLNPIIVDSESVSPYWNTREGPYPAKTDHFGIAKPLNQQDDLYQWVAARIQRNLQGYSPAVIDRLSIEFKESRFQFDTQSKLPENTFLSRRLPAVRIFTELPFATYDCFSNEKFELVKKSSDQLVFSNEAASPAIIFRFYYSRQTGDIEINFNDLMTNQNKPISYGDRLSFVRFQRALFSNARIVFWDIEHNRALFRTGPTLPTNLAQTRNGDTIESLLAEIVRIERYFGIQFKFRTEYTSDDILGVQYARRVLNGETIEDAEMQITLTTMDEKREFLKGTVPANYVNDYRYQFNFSKDENSILGSLVDLGSWTLMVPEAVFDPPIDTIRSTLLENPKPVSIMIHSLNTSKPIKLSHDSISLENELKPTKPFDF